MRVWDKLSLRARLGLFYALILIFSVVLVGYCSYWNIWQLFLSNKSSHIRARAKPLIEHWIIDNHFDRLPLSCLKLNTDNTLTLARDLTSRDTVAIVFNRKGELIANGKELPEEPEPARPLKDYLLMAMSGQNEVTYLSRINGKYVLVLLIPLRQQPATRRIFGVIQITTPLTDIRYILFRHGALLVSLVFIILMLGIAAGFWLIKVSLKDLRELSTTCSQISKGNFSRRMSIINRRDEIGQLAYSFNRMAEKLEATFSSQQRFVANVAHELMTPLTGLRGSLEVLLRGVQDDPSAMARLSKGMYKEVSRLIKLCKQLLGLLRLENTPNVHKELLVLPEFFSDFMIQAEVLGGKRRVVLQQGPYVRIWADPDLLKQILFNLLSNALRYSPPDTSVIISWKLLPEHVEIRVADNGQGMDSATLSHIFEPFYQGKSDVVSGDKGIGLGLCLAKSMVEVHEGVIRVQSEPGKGTTVCFTLPLA